MIWRNPSILAATLALALLLTAIACSRHEGEASVAIFVPPDYVDSQLYVDGELAGTIRKSFMQPDPPTISVDENFWVPIGTHTFTVRKTGLPDLTREVECGYREIYISFLDDLPPKAIRDTVLSEETISGPWIYQSGPSSFDEIESWTPEFGQLAKVDSRQRKGAHRTWQREGSTLLS